MSDSHDKIPAGKMTTPQATNGLSRRRMFRTLIASTVAVGAAIALAGLKAKFR